MTATVTSIHGVSLPSTFEGDLKEVREAYRFLLQERLRAHALVAKVLKEVESIEDAAEYSLQARVLDYLLDGHSAEDLEAISDDLPGMALDVREHLKNSFEDLA
ncbi:MAG: hypothetical protein ACTHJ9_14470 [Rhodanobacter sp.]